MKKLHTFQTLMLALALCGACNQPNGDRAGKQLVSPGGLRLTVMPVKDSYGADQVEVAILLYNGGRAAELPWSDDTVDLLVIGPEGRRIPRRPSRQAEHGYDSGRLLALPFRGIAGEVVNLSCATFEQSPVQDPPACRWSFDFSRKGRYRVAARYSTLPEPGIVNPIRGRDYVELESDTVEVYVK